jgi:hypothetical protein
MIKTDPLEKHFDKKPHGTIQNFSGSRIKT